MMFKTRKNYVIAVEISFQNGKAEWTLLEAKQENFPKWWTDFL